MRERVTQRLPLMELPEAVLEMHAQTNFVSAFTHVSDGNARAEDLSLSICAVLIAEVCNIGLTPVVNPANPALTYDRLTWVQQNYIRAETLGRANAMLVDAQAKLTLAQAWGGGEVASADGLRIIVPVQTINAGYNSKYFGVGRGVTYYNFTSDQFSGFNAVYGARNLATRSRPPAIDIYLLTFAPLDLNPLQRYVLSPYQWLSFIRRR